MSTDQAEQVSGIEMSDPEIEEFLSERGHGILSLTRGGETYGMPMSFGYDGDRLFMQFIEFGEDSRKVEFLDGTERACLTVYDVETRFEWRSVIVTGTLSDVPDEEKGHAEDTLEDNGWFPHIFPPTEPMSGVRRLAMTVEEATGRKGPEHQN